MLAGCKVKQSETGDTEGFLALIQEENLNGRHRSLTTHYGLSGHFFKEEGAIVLEQDPFGQGGILLSDRRFKDFELRFEFKGDPGTNGGLLLRSAESGTAYQLELVGDGGKGTGAFFGEMLQVEKTVPAPDLDQIWKRGDWNSLTCSVMFGKG
ncbi:MAG: family 16 glycoside hydrolase [Cyclobacteriaceae bacterium]